eukprot:364282-Chlamydomonas_euryale.AAC.15
MCRPVSVHALRGCAAPPFPTCAAKIGWDVLPGLRSQRIRYSAPRRSVYSSGACTFRWAFCVDDVWTVWTQALLLQEGRIKCGAAVRTGGRADSRGVATVEAWK